MKTAIKATIIGALIASFAFVLALAVHWQHKYDSAHFEVRKLTATTARQQQVSRKELHDLRYKLIDSLGIKRVERITEIQIKTKHIDRIRWRDSLIIRHDTIRTARTFRSVSKCIVIVVTDHGDTALVDAALAIPVSIIFHRGNRIYPAWQFWRNRRTPFVTATSPCAAVEVESLQVE